MARATPPARSAVSPPADTARAGALLPLALVAAYYGDYIAVMSPPTVSKALRVRDVVGEGQRVSTLSTVLSVGAFAAAIASPLRGALSDRTTLRFGKRRTWLVIGPIEPGMRGRVSGLMGPAMPVGMVAATLLVSLLDFSPALMLLVPGLIGVAGAALLVAVVPDAPADKTALPPLGPRVLLQLLREPAPPPRLRLGLRQSVPDVLRRLLIVGADDSYPPLVVVGAVCSALAIAALAGVRGVR
ncbi:MFS transporter [Streptomyces sp. NPDC002623]